MCFSVCVCVLHCVRSCNFLFFLLVCCEHLSHSGCMNTEEITSHDDDIYYIYIFCCRFLFGIIYCYYSLENGNLYCRGKLNFERVGKGKRSTHNILQPQFHCWCNCHPFILRFFSYLLKMSKRDVFRCWHFKSKFIRLLFIYSLHSRCHIERAVRVRGKQRN